MRTMCVKQLGAMVLLILAVMTGGCAVQLAPLYDKALVEGVTAVNADTLELLASVVDGADKTTFSAREPAYSKIIGKLDALALQSAARPIPTNDVTETLKKKFGPRAGPSDIVPSATAIQEISKAVAKMRDTDKKQGVTAMEVSAFKGQISIYMDQALTYEAALER